MSRRSRRRILKGLGVVLPAAWARPVVETVILPAHARTSQISTSVNCSAPAGCYNFTGGSFLWFGGAGPYTIAPNSTSDCAGGGLAAMREIVVAGSEAEAEAVLGCAVVQLSTTPSPAGCNFFVCDLT